MFAAVKYVRDSEKTDRVWENIKENIKSSAKNSMPVRTGQA